jgi:UDP-GlcNAc:undecaprenyl-phosphate GlcNAc-1-phosphate transferase
MTKKSPGFSSGDFFVRIEKSFLCSIFELYFPSAVTFFLSVFFSVCVLHLFPRWGIMDNPKKYGHDRKPIPHPGGVAPVLAFLLALLFFFPFEGKFIGLLVGLGIISVISFWDDRRHLPAWFRLCAHIMAATIVVFFGLEIEYLGNPFGETLHLSQIFFLLPGIITVIWLVGFANVLNWLDGIPGLSASSAMAAGIFLGMLSITPLVSQPQIAQLSFVFAASAAGFLLFNIHPPKMLLGDTGAMFFGFFLAALSVFSGGKMATVFVVLALPMLDAMYVIVRRLLSGKNPLAGRDNLHLHDRLLIIGFSNREILLLFLSLSILLGWLSLQLQTLGKIILVLCLGALFLIFSWLLEKLISRKTLSSLK